MSAKLLFSKIGIFSSAIAAICICLSAACSNEAGVDTLPPGNTGNNPFFPMLYGHTPRAGILNGQPKSFLVTGYSTSHRPRTPWPSILQDMLNAHAGNTSTYTVFRHSISGTPIAKWTDICGTGQHIADALNFYVTSGDSVPAGTAKASIMLAQQSLQWAFGDCDDRFTSIAGPNDTDKINQGADAIVYFTEQFLNGGIQEVYMATHIYKPGAYTLNLCGEKYALEVALDRLANFYPGPELCEITQTLWPGGYAADQNHPDTPVASAMALYWYIVLAGEDAKTAVMQPVAAAAGIPIPSS